MNIAQHKQRAGDAYDAANKVYSLKDPASIREAGRLMLEAHNHYSAAVAIMVEGDLLGEERANAARVTSLLAHNCLSYHLNCIKDASLLEDATAGQA